MAYPKIWVCSDIIICAHHKLNRVLRGEKVYHELSARTCSGKLARMSQTLSRIA